MEAGYSNRLFWKINSPTKLYIALFFSFPLALISQPELDTNRLQQLNLLIEKHEAGPLDSLIFFYRQKIDLLKSADEMAEWVDTYLDLSLTNPETTLSYLDTMNASFWRSPRDAEEKTALLWCFMYHGYYLKEAGDIIGSARAYEKALDAYSEISAEDFDIIEWVYKPLGNHYTRLGENEKAINLFTKAIGLAREKYSSNTLAGLFNNLGLAYWNQARYTLAIEQYQKGLSLSELTARNKALLLSNLAGSYFDSGEIEKAWEIAARADQLLNALRKQNDNDQQLMAWLSGNTKIRGLIQVAQKKYTAAANSFKEARETGLQASGGTPNRQIGKIYIELGNLRQLEGRLDEALIYYNQALMAVLPNYKPALTTDNPSSDDLYEENTLFEALEGKANTLFSKYQADPQIKWLKSSLECHQLASRAESLLRQTYQYQSSKLRLQGFSRQRSEQAIEVAHLLFLKTQDPAFVSSAFQFAEQNKATILLEAVKRNVSLQKVAQGDSLFSAERQWRRLQADIARQIIEAKLSDRPESALKELNEQQSEIKAKLVEIRQRMELKYPELAQARRQSGPLSLKQVQEELQYYNSELIEFFEGKKAVYRFRISPDEPPQLIKIAHTEEAKRLLNTFTGYFSSSKKIANAPIDYLASANEAFELLLGNDFTAKTNKDLIIIPDGQLNFIPFEALLSEPATDVNLATAPYFLRERNLYYAFSAGLWQAQQLRSSPDHRSLLLMAPAFLKGERGFLPLDYSTADLRKLSSTFKHSQLLQEDKAKLGSFIHLAPNFQIIHLSTHASTNDLNTPPNIAFIDSTLYLPQIYSLNIPAELVVLSACETGVGELRSGEGIMSLARSFFYAGAGAMVSSLWKVNDQATSTLFLDFYGQIIEKVSTAGALRNAKLNYLNNPNIIDARKSPYYWAGLVFIGKDKVLEIETKNGISAWWGAVLGILVFFAMGYFLRNAGFGKNK